MAGLGAQSSAFFGHALPSQTKSHLSSSAHTGRTAQSLLSLNPCTQTYLLVPCLHEVVQCMLIWAVPCVLRTYLPRAQRSGSAAALTRQTQPCELNVNYSAQFPRGHAVGASPFGCCMQLLHIFASSSPCTTQNKQARHRNHAVQLIHTRSAREVQERSGQSTPPAPAGRNVPGSSL